MTPIQFEWDENKNKANQKKHKVTFEEAQTAFYDENARLIPDPDHSQNEERFILLGLTDQLKMLVVVHCYRQNDEDIRIISARKTTKKEEKQYHRRK